MVDWIRPGVYISNIFPALFNKWNWGNPRLAIALGGLDLVCSLSDTAKEWRYVRLAKVVGAAYYGGSFALHLYHGVNGDYPLIGQSLFDAAMAYQLGKDTFDYYRADRGPFNFRPRQGRMNDLLKDLALWKPLEENEE
jgi:hypothetical protein